MSEQTRYLTNDLLIRATSQTSDTLKESSRLVFKRQHSDNHYIRTIENLHLLPNLRELIINDHAITSLSGILPGLRLLDLSLNRITCFDNIQALTSIEILILNDNHISHIPPSLSKLKSLTELRLSGNPITSLREVQHLSKSCSLSTLCLTRTPISDLPHYRLFTCYCIPSLNHLDSSSILESEREEARTRFLDVEQRSLRVQLSEKNELYQGVVNENTALQNRVSELEAEVKRIHTKSRAVVQERNSLVFKLDETESTLKKRGQELVKASNRIAELEQQLAASDDDDLSFLFFG
ncbi:hypothetical protein GEMRC1_007441 [Eukaryota sp. GEM-RC1]